MVMHIMSLPVEEDGETESVENVNTVVLLSEKLFSVCITSDTSSELVVMNWFVVLVNFTGEVHLFITSLEFVSFERNVLMRLLSAACSNSWWAGLMLVVDLVEKDDEFFTFWLTFWFDRPTAVVFSELIFVELFMIAGWLSVSMCFWIS